MRRFWDDMLQVVLKDLRVEFRSREVLHTTVLLAVLLVVVFSFSFAAEGQAKADAAGGLLWIAIAFAGTLGMSRIFDRERQHDTLGALLLAPASRSALYLGKLVGITVYLALTEVVLVPLLLLLLGLQPGSVALLVGLVALGNVGFAAVGSLFAAALTRAHGGREVLLGLLLFPVVTPLLAAAARGTAALLALPAEPQVALSWLKLVAAFDLLFLALALLVFDALVSTD